MLFVDIGSMKGEEIEWALEKGYEIHAFEPNPNMKPFLEKYEEKATVNYTAAWDREGASNLYLMGNPEYDTDEDGVSLVSVKENLDKNRFVEVQTTNIGRYLRILDKDVHLLKINAEGAEYVIIQSILNEWDPKRIKYWYVEDHQDFISDNKWRNHRAEVLKKLDEKGIVLKEWKGLKKFKKYELLAR